MGWTSYYVGKSFSFQERKEACDKLFSGKWNNMVWSVVKSTMKGATYYAAVKNKNLETGEYVIFGMVVLTSLKQGEFYYKEVSEDMGPVESDCPISILNLLTPTDNKYANEWRERCKRKHTSKRDFSSLPIGTVIEWGSGSFTHRAIKMPPAFQFKSTWFKDFDKNTYWRKKDIGLNWKVVAQYSY